MTEDLPALAQMPFESNEFANNPEPRCPCILLLDTSGSMSGRPLEQLNAAYAQFVQELLDDSLAAKRVELCVINFGPVQMHQDFKTPTNTYPEPLEVTGATPMGEAILFAISELDARKATYQAHGIGYFRPWIFLITDGAPTDAWTKAAKAVREGEESKAFCFFAIGVEGADMDTLAKIAVRDPIKLRGLQFAEMFRWLSNSLRAVSRSQPDETVALPPPSGWTEV